MEVEVDGEGGKYYEMRDVEGLGKGKLGKGKGKGK